VALTQLESAEQIKNYMPGFVCRVVFGSAQLTTAA